MNFLLRIAVLGLRRHLRRSLITVSAIAVGLTAMIFLWAFMDGYQDQQRENAIRLFTGHIQVHARTFQDRLAPELILPERSRVLEALPNLPELVSSTERVRTEVLVGTATGSHGAILLGVDPVREAQVTALPTQVSVGKFLTSQNGRELVIGDRLASKIGAQLGDKVVVMTQDREGTLAGSSYRVVGLLHTGTALDQMLALITLPAAQELLGLGADIHELVLRLTDRRGIPAAQQALAAATSGEKFEVLSWDQIIPEIEQWASWAGAIIGAILMVVISVIAIGVANTIFISTLERTRELGVMLALGTSPNQVLSLVILEAVVMGTIGILLGLAAGYSLIGYYARYGIHFTGFEAAARQAFMDPVIYPEARAARALSSVTLLALATLFAGLYPAWRASRIEPVQAIYHS